MKIAFVVSSFPALSETFILNQITGLLDLGHEVDIYSLSTSNINIFHPDVEKYNLLSRTYYSHEIPQNKLIRVFKAFKLISNSFSKNLHNILASLNVFKYGEESLFLHFLYYIATFPKNQYDIIHCHFGPNGRFGLLLKECNLGKMLITTFHGFDAHSFVRRRGKRVYKILFKKGDLFTVNTNFTKDKVIELGCNEEKIVKLPMGLNLERFKFKYKPFGVRKSNVKILTIARFVEKKGLEYSINAVSRVIRKHPDIEYRIVGDGPLRDRLERLVKKLEVCGNVKLLGWRGQEDILQLYQDSDIFILTSITSHDGDQEGQGLVLQEAQAIGLPVISTLHNGIPEGVLNGKSGFLVREKNVDELTDRIFYLVEHQEIWPEMAMSGRQFVERHYDIKKLNDQLVCIYKGLLSKKSF